MRDTRDGRTQAIDRLEFLARKSSGRVHGGGFFFAFEGLLRQDARLDVGMAVASLRKRGTPLVAEQGTPLSSRLAPWATWEDVVDAVIDWNRARASARLLGAGIEIYLQE
jgi:hypothetical protein